MVYFTTVTSTLFNITCRGLRVMLQSTINYWCRCKHYRHVISTAEEGLKRYANDPFLKFSVAFGMMMEGNDTCIVMLKALNCYYYYYYYYTN